MLLSLSMYWLPIQVLLCKSWFDPVLQITQRSAEETMLYNFHHVYAKNKGIDVTKMSS